MEIKATEAMRVIYCERRIALPQVPTTSAEVSPLIEGEIARCAMQIAGPWVFIAHNLPKESKTLFNLRICRPVRFEGPYDGPATMLDLEPIMVASALHQGSIRTLFTQGYAPLLAEIDRSRHVHSGESREIYHAWNGAKAKYHSIEIQFGLAR
ncbi:MAG: hypothetical protein ACOH2M_29325 [Cypionkella sp.]